MNEDRELSIPEFMDEIGPELARRVDEWILAQDAEDRPLLIRNREKIIREFTRATELANWKARCERLEQRLRPQLVEVR
jgi:hypothetical protein